MEKIRYLNKQNLVNSKTTRKGTRFKIKNNFFFKIYDRKSFNYSVKERDSRFINEVNALEILNKKKCFFVPKVFLINKKKKFLKFKYLTGPTIKEILDNYNNNFKIKNIIKDILKIDRWLKKNKIYLKSHNIKDFIYDKDKNLYLIDFEFYSNKSKKDTFIKDFQYDLILRYFDFDQNREIKKNINSNKFFMFFFKNYKFYFCINFLMMLFETLKKRIK